MSGPGWGPRGGQQQDTAEGDLGRGSTAEGGAQHDGYRVHMWKGEDWERLVATVRGIQGSRDGATVILLLITSPREKAP